MIDSTINHIFSHEERRLKAAEYLLIQENAKMMAEQGQPRPDTFYYAGYRFSHMETQLIASSVKGRLNAQLFWKADNHIKDLKELEFDKVRVRQTLAIILKDCHSPQDVRDVLPEVLASSLKDISSLARFREEAYTLKDNPRLLKQYEKLKEKIEFYMASKYMY